MPIDQSKLDALKTLATGGSAGLDAYRQAQSAESASRTDALKGALGGQDVYAAAQKAQAQYAPNVGTKGFADAANLAPAANQFLDQGAQKLSQQAHENQQNLLYQIAQMKGANAKEQLAGAADVYGQSQRDTLAGGQSQLQATVARKQELLNEKNRLALQVPQGSDSGMGFTPEQQAANAQRVAQIDAELGGLDRQYGDQAARYAGALGLDANGLNAAYQSGDNNKVADLLGYLKGNEGEAQRKIDMGGQERLRELAPAFGIDPLAAVGMFQRGEGNDLQRTGTEQKQEDYISGTPSADDQAQMLGYADAGALKSAQKATGMGVEDLARTAQSDNFRQIDQLTQAYTAEGGDTYTDAEGKQTQDTGLEGYRNAVHRWVSGAKHPDGTDLTNSEKQQLINLATSTFNKRIQAAFGKGESGDE